MLPDPLCTSFVIGRDGTRERVIEMYEIHLRHSPDLIATHKEAEETCATPEPKRQFAETTGCSTRNCAIPTKAPITSWLEERIIEALDPQRQPHGLESIWRLATP